MTDFSKIKTIDELDYQTTRLQRRADIQRERLNGHVDFVVRQYNYLVSSIDSIVTPIRNKVNEYRGVANVLFRLAKSLFGK